jgi:predicted nucleic acid-binding protein
LKVFLDANVIFSASLPNAGGARALLYEAARCGAMCISSDRALAEAQRNLLLKAPHAMTGYAQMAARIVTVPEPAQAAIDRAHEAGVVAKDAPVFGAALACAADWFVTGDMRHFGHLFGMHIEGVLVLPLRAAFERLSSMLPPRTARGPAK